jgi:hypothetical protein
MMKSAGKSLLIFTHIYTSIYIYILTPSYTYVFTYITACAITGHNCLGHALLGHAPQLPGLCA